jgi:hypothetical protein
LSFTSAQAIAFTNFQQYGGYDPTTGQPNQPDWTVYANSEFAKCTKVIGLIETPGLAAQAANSQAYQMVSPQIQFVWKCFLVCIEDFACDVRQNKPRNLPTVEEWLKRGGRV